MASVQWEKKQRGKIFLHRCIWSAGLLKATWRVKDVSAGPVLRGERVSGSPRAGILWNKEKPFSLEKATKRAGWNHAAVESVERSGNPRISRQRASLEISPPLMGNPVQIVKQPPELLRKNLPRKSKELPRWCVGLKKKAKLSEIAALAGCSEMPLFGK